MQVRIKPSKEPAPGTPQENECIEHNFAILFNGVHAMLNGGKFTAYLQSSLWAVAANTATNVKNHLITSNMTLSPFQQFFGKGKKSVLTSMQTFSDMCIITYKDNIHWAKLLAMLKTFLPVHTRFSIQKQKKSFLPGM